jgi:hypothetical protein
MHGTKDIIQEAAALPVEERIIVVDSLLRTKFVDPWTRGGKKPLRVEGRLYPPLCERGPRGGSKGRRRRSSCRRKPASSKGVRMTPPCV